MPSQHITEETATKEGVLVPLDLPELQIVRQEWLANGTLRIEVIATLTQAACPHCQKMVLRHLPCKAHAEDLEFKDGQVIRRQ